VESNVQIRFASPDESDAIAAVISESFAEFETFYTSEAFAATTPNAEKVRERFDEGVIWAALKNGEVVGTVSVVVKGEKLYIRSMAVSPTAQGLGIGRKLLETVESFAFENGFERLFLYTTLFLSGAIRLYEQSGFKRGELETEGFFGTSRLAMEKKLNR